MATGPRGFTIVNLSDPDAPEIIGESFEGVNDDAGYCKDLEVTGVMVYGEGYSCDFDYENPLVIPSGEARDIPVVFASDEVGYHCGEIAIISDHPGNDQFVYLTTYVRGDEGAALMADINLGGNVHTSEVLGDIAFVGTSEGLNIIDIRDPLHPEVIVQDWGDRQYRLLDIQGDILAAVTYSGGLWRLVTINISDPEHPVRLDDLVTDEVPTDICYFQNVIYITFLRDMWITNLRGFYVSNPSDIQSMGLGAIGLGDNLVTMDMVGNYLYIGDRDEGMFVVSIHDRWNPYIVGYMEQEIGDCCAAVYLYNSNPDVSGCEVYENVRISANH